MDGLINIWETELGRALENLEGFLDEASFQIWTRGKDIAGNNGVKIQEVSEDPVFQVGSQLNFDTAYQVRFANLTDELEEAQGSCTCPYAEENSVCKHMVASALAFRQYCREMLQKGYMDFPGNRIESLSELEAIDEKALKSLTDSDLTVRKAYNQFETPENFKVKKVEAGHIELYVHPVNQKTPFKVTLSKAKQGISAKCQCGKTNLQSLCWHAFAAFLYTRNNFAPNFFTMNEGEFEGLQNAKSELLAEYGFSMDDNITGLFEFEIQKQGHLSMKVLDPALKPVSEHYNWQDYTRSLTPEKAFPASLTHQNQQQGQFGIGFGLFLPKKWEKYDLFNYYSTTYLPDFDIIPLKGKLKKKEYAFASRIEPVPIEDVVSSQPDLTQDSIQRIQEIGTLNMEDMATEVRALLSDHQGGFKKIDTRHLDEASLNTALDVIRQKVVKALPYLEGQYVVILDHPHRITTQTISRVTISDEPAKVFFKVQEDDTFLKAQFGLQLRDQRIHFNDPEFEEVKFLSYWFLLYSDILFPITTMEDIKAVYQFEEQGEIKVNKSDFTGFFKDFVEPLTQKFPVKMNLEREVKEVNVDDPELKVYLKELDNFLIFQPAVDYDGTEVELDNGEAFWQHAEDTLFKINRNKEREQFLEDTLRSLHPQFQKQINNEYFYLSAQELMKNHWFLDAFQLLRDNGIAVYGQNELNNLKFNTHKPSVSMNVSSGIDWFDVEVEVTFGDQAVRPKDVRKALQKGENFVKLGDGTYGVLPDEWLKKYENLFRYGNMKKDKVEFPKTHFNLLDDLYEEMDNTAVMEEIREKKRKLENFRELEQKPIPGNIEAELRDYQKEGFYWMNFLDEFQWGGCLADDMGLGKTLQVLTFLQYKKDQGVTKPSLIVVPTTLIFNWEDEIRKFAPQLSYFVNWGNSRLKSQEEFNGYELIIASYDILKNDIELFSEFTFHYVILDEAQAIKNPKSQRYKAVSLLKADNRLTLTGTPLENNTFDLYSQMSFLNPGFLGSQENFKSEFATPIDKNKDPDKMQKLRKLVHPFIMRRKKEQVEQELPEKTVDVLYCEMDAKQKKVYDAFKNDFRDKILKKVDAEGINNSQFYILQGLLKLRQICDSPALLNEEEDYGNHSTKLNELLNHVTEKTGEHKILIFSQFVGMLQMIKKELEHTGVDFEYLDGQTQKRQEKVGRFQNDDNCRVFLISLKAGGTGLNLTEADYVYIVDPWWNPAVEEQAIDRTHRIGQNKHIFGYKMICKDTIEEKVIQLQNKKSELANEVVGSDQGFVKNLSRDDLKELFS